MAGAAWSLALLGIGLFATAQEPPIRRIARLEIPGAETVAYDRATNCAFVSCAAGVAVVHLGGGDDAKTIRTVDVAAAMGEDCAGEVTHVAVDPAGRGFAAATVIPADPILRSSLQGKVVFLSTRTCRPLATAWVGHGPDSCAFSPDGARLVVANEGEPAVDPASGAVLDPPGSVSVVDLRGVRGEEDVAALRQTNVATVWFAGEACAGAAGLRIHPAQRAAPGFDIEPEYVAVHAGQAWISLQENNGIAVLDLETLRFARVAGLRAAARALDALPMPDQIAVMQYGDRLVLLTADEGDFRGEVGQAPPALADHVRLGDRTIVCAFSGAGQDGVIERPVMLGARSVSAWDAGTLERISDTGGTLERMAIECAGAKYDEKETFEAGPQPEGICAALVAGRALALVTLERPGALAIVDATDPERLAVVAMHDAAGEGDTNPEGLAFVPAIDSPADAPLVLVAYEKSGTLAVYAVNELPAGL